MSAMRSTALTILGAVLVQPRFSIPDSGRRIIWLALCFFFSSTDPDASSGMRTPLIAATFARSLGGAYAFHVGAGSNGSTVLVFAPMADSGMEPSGPGIWLLDKNGVVLDGPVPLDDTSRYHTFWGPLGLFWEGDAYSMLWNTWPDEYILYRRFRVSG